MSTNAQVQQDHPMMRAWNAHKTTPEYANSKSWAQHAEHVEGSLWALFMAGWTAAQGCGCQPGTCESKPDGWPCIRMRDSLRAELTASREREARMRALIADDSYAMTFQSFGQYRTALLRELASKTPTGEIERLHGKLATYQERERLLIQKLTYVLQQNDCDMLLTGEEIRECRTILERLQTK